MIFVTVGTQLPFDRMVRTVDRWAGARGRSDVFAQIGPSDYAPRHMKSSGFLPADQCLEHIRGADAIIAHAGMGSILTALEYGKPIIVMPRRADLMEHRNDHQIATAKKMLAQGRIRVAFDEGELEQQLDDLSRSAVTGHAPAVTSPTLIRSLRRFVEMGIRGSGSGSSVGIPMHALAGN